jgi:hypothetical protein
MDAVGYMDTVGANYKINIDRSAPHTTQASTKSAEKCKNIVNLYAEDYYSGVNKTFYRVNSGAWNAGTQIKLEKAGENTVEYYSVDNAGNSEEINTANIVNTGIVLSQNMKNVSCPGKNDGAINITIEGGEAPYTYLWSNKATSKDLKCINKGIYELTITDHSGCIANLKDTITEPLFSLEVAKTDDPDGECKGEAKVMITGGVAPFKYHWNGVCSKGDSIASHLCTGLYTVVVTDAKQCSVMDSVMITGNGENCFIFPNPTGGIFTINLPGVKAQKIEITLSTVGGKTMLKKTFNFVPPSMEMSIENLPSNTYILKVKIDKKTFIRKIVKLSGKRKDI